MTPQEAIEAAKAYVKEVFSTEGAFNVGLEEIRFDDHRDLWLITVGFTRGWDSPGLISRVTETGPLPRTFKTVEINDEDGRVLGMSHWPIAA